MKTILAPGFAYLNDERIIQALQYVGADNFTGHKVEGYQANKVILTHEALDALSKIQDELDALELGLFLKIFDAYRPTRAVASFKQWALTSDSPSHKVRFYPDLDKAALFSQGYIAEASSHSRGSTVDITLCEFDIETGIYLDLDMGTAFDFFGEASHTFFEPLTEEQADNRSLLLYLMEKHGFKNLEQEWWHYTLVDEPFKDQAFDFPVA